MKLYLATGNSSANTERKKLKLLNYNYKLHYVKKLLSVNAVPYRALLISRLNDHGGLSHISLAIKIFPPEDFQQLFSINIIIR